MYILRLCRWLFIPLGFCFPWSILCVPVRYSLFTGRRVPVLRGGYFIGSHNIEELPVLLAFLLFVCRRVSS